MERYGTQVSIYNVFSRYDTEKLGGGGGKYSDAKVDKRILQLYFNFHITNLQDNFLTQVFNLESFFCNHENHEIKSCKKDFNIRL